MKTGNRLWTSSDEMSMNIEPKPSTQMPFGKARYARDAGAGLLDSPAAGGVIYGRFFAVFMYSLYQAYQSHTIRVFCAS